MTSCIDCLHCKQIHNRTRLTCDERGWDCRIVKLAPKEITHGKIRHRTMFIKARHCQKFDDMTVEEGGSA